MRHPTIEDATPQYSLNVGMFDIPTFVYLPIVSASDDTSLGWRKGLTNFLPD
ncbi:hypothetical protein [Roseiflexus sp.]|uniref:hypothetical protein n=1 Tax=Roseiflexus sp. TaxID=2562120 RepID=UPI00398B53CC